MTDEEAELLAIEARDSISTYCYTECKSLCCRKSHLLLKADEVELFKTGHDLKIIQVDDKAERFVLDLGENEGCPNLSEFKCIIHKNPKRPKTCKEFPLFVWENKTVMATYACPAVKENKLYAYLAEFKSKGYNVIYREG